jgi:glutamine synthetase
MCYRVGELGMGIEREEIVTICCSDIAGQVRGKGFPVLELKNRTRFGVGWTPTNVMINCLGRIPATPFGATGDLLLVPRAGGEVTIDLGENIPVERLVLGDILTLKGEPWDCCLRSFLQRALDDLETQTGLRILASFEHEFHIDNATERPGDSYAVSSLRGLEPFIGDVIGVLRANNIAPDTFLPEFGPRQFEVTIDPAWGLAAADQAVKLREICRAVGRRHGHHISFSPVVTRGIVGNGVHIHFSLIDKEGAPATYKAGAPGSLSSVAASFAAGIIRHARALCAITAPSAISYERLKPHSWSAYYANLADRDREALLRICPFPEMEGVDVAKRFNLEYRAADATASPYLQLAMLVYAGLAGIEDKLAVPYLSSGDPGTLGAEERASRGIGDLPRTLGEALDALESDEKAIGWMGPMLSQAYLMHKRGELAMTKDTDMDELCRIYAMAY